MPIAVVSAISAPDAQVTGSHVLAVVELSDPENPRALKVIALPGSASGVQVGQAPPFDVRID
jgi:hypothetical protein